MFADLDVLEALPPQLEKCAVAEGVTNAVIAGRYFRHIICIFLIDLLDLAGFNVHLISMVGNFVANHVKITLHPRVSFLRLLAIRSF
jgi:hypothetical protein